MKAKFPAIALAIAFASLAISLVAIRKNRIPDGGSESQAERERSNLSALDAVPTDAVAEARIAALERALGTAVAKSDAAGSDEGTASIPLGQRLDALEASLAKLQQAFDGISLEVASDERDALFRSENGYLKADEYLAAGKFAIAGEGYLVFLEDHADHPEAYDILKRARQSFQRAGYKDKAIWAQEELLRNLPERRADEVATLAALEKEAGHLDSAIEHAAEAAELTTENSARLWKRLYWAWYNQLRDGDQAGLDAYRQVEQEIETSGYTDHKLGERVREKIAEIERASSAAAR